MQKIGSQETPGVTGEFGLGIRNEAGQRLIEFCQENALVITNTLFQQMYQYLYTYTLHMHTSCPQFDGDPLFKKLCIEKSHISQHL